MTSEMAREDIEKLQSEGLYPSVKDIIRLNGLALKYERVKKQRSFSSMWYLPRVAAVSNDMWFRQPTIGHDIWISQVSQWINMTNYGTSLAVYAYALSRDWKDLPDANDRTVVQKAIDDFLKTLGGYTEEQVLAALEYVQSGLSAVDDEYGEPKKETGEEDDEEDEDWGLCISLGTLNKAKAVLWGVTETEAKSMTREELDDVIEKSYKFHNVDADDSGKYELGAYYRTLDAIRERLEEEKRKEEKVKDNG